MHLYSLVAWHEQPDNEPEEGEGKAETSSEKVTCSQTVAQQITSRAEHVVGSPPVPP